MIGFASALAPGIARPPTPPKENPTKLADDVLEALPFNGLTNPLVDTPEESPSSSSEYFKGSSGKLRKKVGFSPWTQYYNNNMTGKEPDSNAHQRYSPPSRGSHPTKSILKLCSGNAVAPSNDTFDQNSLPAMLQSTILHLRSDLRSSRQDAYTTLLACLSAYDDIPESQDLAEKTFEITGCIRRDLTSKAGDAGALDIKLAIQALKVLTVFTVTPRLAANVSNDFWAFILEQSILSIEDSQSPKILVTHFMHLLEKQKFASKQMATDRVNRLLTALDSVTTRVKGNRVVSHRLMIYHRLLVQARSVMVSRVASWLDHLVSGMLSSMKDIRARAIGFGVDAGLHLGTTGSVSQACLELFNRASPDGKMFIEFLSSRLTEMIGLKEDGAHVPQIWSVIILFLRSRRRQLECWEHIKTWLSLIQRCFNSNDVQIKFQASMAWNRLIYAVNLDTSTSSSMAKMLRQPIVSSLERKVSDKNSKQTKEVARSSYCTLLYYAFRPNATHAQLDLYWDLYVSQVMSNCFVVSNTEVNYAFNILTALFSGTGKPKIWEEKRANMSGPVKPEDVPCLDPKWIRLRSAKILQTFDKLEDLVDWQADEDPELPVLAAWRSFTIALGNASSKEVKPSMETMTAIAHILNEIKRLLDRGSEDNSKERQARNQHKAGVVQQPDTIEKARLFVHEAMTSIGTIPFNERRVVHTSQDFFEVSETPSVRSNRDTTSQNSPLMHLISLLLKYAPEEADSGSFRGALKDMLLGALQSATSRRTQFAVLRNLARLFSPENDLSPVANTIFWQILAEAACMAIALPTQNETHNEGPQPVGHEYRDAVKILELGLQHYSTASIPLWQRLHDRIVSSLRQEVGPDAITLIMTENLSSSLYKKGATYDKFSCACALSVLSALHWPGSGHSLERAQKSLWGVIHVAFKRDSVDPFDNLYSMLDPLFKTAYESYEGSSMIDVEPLVLATSHFLRCCPDKLQARVLARLQLSLGLWIEDPEGKLAVSRLPSTKNVWLRVREMWLAARHILEKLDRYDSKILLQFHGLLTCIFKSRHRSIVNEALLMWKDTFGSAESLEYPQEMRKILLKLRSLTDIRLPGLVEAEGDEPAHSPIPFVGSQEDTEDRSLLAKGKSPIGQQIHGTLGIFAKSIKQSLLSPSSKPALLLGGTPGSARRTIKTTPKARLRHDDSQIQFAAIESSPAEEEAGESQTLTDRQKEVRERQSQDTAAMFPDIRSSPRAASRDPQPTLPKLVFQPNGTEPPQSTMDDDSSPVFPPDALMNDFLGSSPTPSSSRKTSTGSHAEDGPPSSPPFVSSHLEQFKKIDPAVGKDLYCAVPSTNLGEPVHGLSKFIARRNDEVMSGTGSGTVVEQAQQYSRERVQTLVPVSIPAQSKEHIFSDSDGDVFVDAPAELHVTQPDAKQAAHDESHATSSISDRVFSLDQLEADQIQAQLTSEMERASSQRSQRLPQSTSQSDASSQYTRKRKDIFDVPPTPAKKPRRSMISSSPQRTLEIRRVDEIVADCVLIDVRPTTGHKSFETVQFKREKSPSPSMITATQFGDVGITRTRKSRTSRPSQENSFLRRNTRQNQVQAEQVDELDVSSLPPAKSTRRASRSTILSSGTPNASSNHEKAVPRNTKRAAVKQRKKKTHEIEAANSSTFNLELDQTQLTPEGDKQPEKKRIARRQSKVSHRDIHKSQTSDERASERSQEREVNVQDETETGEDPRGILQGFQDMLEKIKRVAMGPEEERATVGVLFECVKEVHDAGRRYTAM